MPSGPTCASLSEFTQMISPFEMILIHSFIYLIYTFSCSFPLSLPLRSPPPFSAVTDMAKLAQETLDCQTELLCGGLGGPNRDRVLQHLISGHPLLIPHPRTWEGAGPGW